MFKGPFPQAQSSPEHLRAITSNAKTGPCATRLVTSGTGFPEPLSRPPRMRPRLWRRPPALALAMTSRLLTKPACVGRHLGAIAQTIKGFSPLEHDVVRSTQPITSCSSSDDSKEHSAASEVHRNQPRARDDARPSKGVCHRCEAERSAPCLDRGGPRCALFRHRRRARLDADQPE